MSKALVAALLLLILSGGSVALLSYSQTSADTNDQDSFVQSGPRQLTPEAIVPQQAEGDSHPNATPPFEAVPTPTQQMPLELPAAFQNPPSPSTDEDTEGGRIDPLQWSHVFPVRRGETRESEDGQADPPQWSLASPARWAPTRIVIPDIGVDTRVTDVGLTVEGAMDAPEDYSEVGWYRHGATPGDAGRAVLAGHVDSATGPAIFYRLHELVPGSIIEVTLGGDAEMVRFVVSGTARYPEHEAPLDRIFGPSDQSELILITCAGVFDRASGLYDERLVIYADRLPDDS
jgi:sortase (surface protein transpeptidase)